MVDLLGNLTKGVYSCNVCDYITCHKKDYNKHLQTKKHKTRTNVYLIFTDNNTSDNENPMNSDKSSKQFPCECGKIYKYKQSRSIHRKKCSLKINIESNSNENNNSEEGMSFKEMFLEMVHQNKELQKVIYEQNKTIQDMVPKIGNNNTNTNNINTVNNVSITVFLNDNCKDALSMDDFIQQIKLEVGDLLFTGKHGLTNGLSNIFIENYNKLPLVKRPLWCSDKKRKRLFIKNDVWEEDKDNMKTKEAIKQLGVIQAKSTPMYAKDNPNWIKDERTKDIYMGIINQTTGDVNEKVDKVIDSLIDKTHLSNEAREKIINNL